MRINEKAISSTNPRWFLDGSDFLILSATAVSTDICAFAASLHGGEFDYYDAQAPYSRLYLFKGNEWSCTEMNVRIAGMVPFREDHSSTDALAIATEDGHIWIVGENSSDSSILTESVEIVDGIFNVGGSLYATSFGGHVYARTSKGWVHDDEGMRDAEPVIPRPRQGDLGPGDFSTNALIATPNGLDYYASGIAYLARPSLFWRSGSSKWKWLGLDATDKDLDYIRINSLYAESDKSIWISTDQGYLLRGNGYEGFRRSTEIVRKKDGSPHSLSEIVKFKGEIYVGGTSTFRLLNDGSLQELYGPSYPEMGAPQEISSEISGKLSVAGEVLWSIGNGVLSRFDGNNWKRIIMPSIYKYPRI